MTRLPSCCFGTGREPFCGGRRGCLTRAVEIIIILENNIKSQRRAVCVIRIALVEDDPVYREQLQNYLTQFGQQSGEKLAVTVFDDGDEIALNYKAEYDIILMDIEMKFMDGMTAAEMIRQKDDQVVIIFITNSPQYAIKGYAVDALDYVLKPVSYYAFSQRIQRAVTRMNRRRQQRCITVTTREGTHKLAFDRINYVEVQTHELIFHTRDGLLTATGSMKELEKSLDSPAFFRCNKSCLVNLEQVDGIQGDDAILAGEPVPISRARKKAFLDALNNYISEVGK